MDSGSGLPLHDELFSALFAQHADALVAFCRRRVGPDEAEEVAQEAFLRAWASRESYSPSRPFWPWLVTIASRICIDRGRRRRVATALAPKAISIFDGVPVERPEEVVEAGAERECARAALADLRPNQRRILTRRTIDGWSYAQIANAEGLSEEAVRGVLRRARRGLRDAYARAAGSAPAAIPIAALRWTRRRMASAPVLNIDFIRASEAAVVAAAALAIGAGPSAAAPSLAAPPVHVVQSTAATRMADREISVAQSTPHARTAASTRTSSATTSSSAHAASTTVTTKPAPVKLVYVADDNEIDQRCAAADIKAKVGRARACVNTQGSIETAKVIISTREVQP